MAVRFKRGSGDFGAAHERHPTEAEATWCGFHLGGTETREAPEVTCRICLTFLASRATIGSTTSEESE